MTAKVVAIRCRRHNYGLRKSENLIYTFECKRCHLTRKISKMYFRFGAFAGHPSRKES